MKDIPYESQIIFILETFTIPFDSCAFIKQLMIWSSFLIGGTNV